MDIASILAFLTGIASWLGATLSGLLIIKQIIEWIQKYFPRT